MFSCTHGKAASTCLTKESEENNDKVKYFSIFHREYYLAACKQKFFRNPQLIITRSTIYYSKKQFLAFCVALELDVERCWDGSLVDRSALAPDLVEL
jgi:hypothetical protein